MPNEILDEILQTTLELAAEPTPAAGADERLPTDDLVAVVRHREVLEALLSGPLDRRDIEAELDVSRATSHRFTRWLAEEGLAVREDDHFRLTGKGQVYAEQLVTFDRNLRAGSSLAPLLDVICEDHQEFVVGPFADATVTTATPADPYRPVARFVSLLERTETFRGFNTTHMAPPGLASVYEHLFDGVETEILYLPTVVENLFEAYPDRAREAIDAGHLTLRTRDALPYGLAIFDDRVAIGGYDDETGTMRVFVDTDSAIARGWAERVFETYRERSEPIEAGADECTDRSSGSTHTE
ncbi:winged helix-turn-helix domain-containing protein [Haloarchaeobius sp. HME9146]|uniref:helix-turn-helix transcriptional regulator n=1 Tax=Haloarchaeobius sp. HME9146 TaxID=2978732 RepID=UPI0021BFFC3D|nr:MarR family transcriptional regulator [Haloarchaeobius sp. HME9146]MCT9095193.1 MarR family transcriptional regulator [Haloarchaeobius sp. HME9146]